MRIPEKLSAFRVYVEGGDKVGIADVQLPVLQAMSESVKGAGIAGEVDAPVSGHFGSMEVSFNWRTLDKSAVELMAPGVLQMDLRGEQEIYNTTSREIEKQGVKVVLTCRPKEFDPGKLDTGAQTGTSSKFEVLYEKITVGGTDVLEYDKYNYIYTVNGTDYMVKTRDNLGLT